MKKLIAVPLFLFLLLACAGQSAKQDDFNASICNNIPVGIEKLAAIDPETKSLKYHVQTLKGVLLLWAGMPHPMCRVNSFQLQ